MIPACDQIPDFGPAAAVPPGLRPAVADALRNAAAVIETNGWTQGRYHQDVPPADVAGPADAEGRLPPELSPVCALGALGVAVLGHPMGIVAAERSSDPDRDADPRRLPSPELRTAAHAIGALAAVIDTPGPARVAIPAWNDTPARTPTEVVAALKTAARLVEQVR